MGPNRTLIEGSPVSSASVAAQTAISGTAGAILTPNPKRKGLTIQNTGTTILYLNFNTTNPTTSVYHIALKACTAGNDGTGGTWVDDAYVGAVTAVGSAGGGTAVITEFFIGQPGVKGWNLASDGGLD